MGRIVDTRTGEIAAEHPSFFERARLICEVLPYRNLGLSRHQINAIEGFSSTIAHTLVEGFRFYYPSEEKPSETFNVQTETTWTLHRKDAKAIVTIEYDGKKSVQEFTRLEEELIPDLSKGRIFQHIYTTILENSAMEFPPSEEESRWLKDEISRQSLHNSLEPEELNYDSGLKKNIEVREFIPKRNYWQRVCRVFSQTPSEIEAVQVDTKARVLDLEWWNKTSKLSFKKFLLNPKIPKRSTFIPVSDLQGGFKVRLAGGETVARSGDWIVIDRDGELGVWQNDAFCQAFEETGRKPHSDM